MEAAAPPINSEVPRSQRPQLDAYIEQARAACARLRDRGPDWADRHETPT
jgi:hypothetical protein